MSKDSPRRSAFARWAAPVQWRTLMAALVPVGILLGPMVMTFVWFKERVDPATWSAPQGSSVQVIATVDSEWKEPVVITLPSGVTLDEATPASYTLPPYRATLERLLALYRQPQNDPAIPWEMKAAPDLSREQTANNLEAYLHAGIPPRRINWLITPSDTALSRFPVTVSTGSQNSLTVNVVLGNQYPPAPSSVDGSGKSPIKQLSIHYPRPDQEPVFWKPLATLSRFPWASRLAATSVGWLTLYVLAYLPVLLLLRWALKVA